MKSITIIKEIISNFVTINFEIFVNDNYILHLFLRPSPYYNL